MNRRCRYLDEVSLIADGCHQVAERTGLEDSHRECNRMQQRNR